MKYTFLKPNNPLLTQTSQEILQDQINSKDIKKIAAQMLKIIQSEQKRYKRGVGLAAPQIGILKRIILVDVTASKKAVGGDLKVFINPKIIWKSKRKGEWYEGCYSTGKICGIVSRSLSIKIQALRFTPQGCKREFRKYSGYVARIFQHEIDHLDGKVFVNLIKDPQNLHWVEKEEFPLYRNKQAWRNWPNKYPLAK